MNTIKGKTMAIDINARLRNSHARVLKRIEEMAAEAMQDIDILAGMFQIRADYEWLLGQVKATLPLGVGGYTWIEVDLIRKLAESQGLGHMADAIIDELNDDPKGPAVIPSRAEIIMRNDEALSIAAF